MPQFEGTVAEFTKFIGAYCRIKVMHIARKYKKETGKCQECESTSKQLEAAHIKGKERPLIISNILSQFIEKDIIKIDLNEFEERFVETHYPIESCIKILCTTCHRNYDKKVKVQEYAGVTQEESPNEKVAIAESKVIEDLLRKTLNKSAAIDIINKNSGTTLNNTNTLFSNINSAIDVWWLEPSNDKFTVGFNFILNFPDTNTLYHFYMPPGIINKPEELFYQRNDSDYSKIYIPKSVNSFIDKKGFDFGKFLINIVKH